MLTGFVLACELFAAKHRTFAGTMIENFWAVAWCISPFLAWLFSNWQHFQIFISLIGLLTIPLFWYVTCFDTFFLNMLVPQCRTSFKGFFLNQFRGFVPTEKQEKQRESLKKLLR